MADASHRYFLSTFLRLSVLSSLLVGVICKRLVDSTHHTVDVSSRLPSPFCKPSPAKSGPQTVSSLKVAHKYGPCNSLSDQVRQPVHAEILKEDLSRVDSIKSRLTPEAASVSTGPSYPGESKTTVVPAKLSGRTLGSGNYLVTLGLGTPWKQVTLIFDTGSDLSWTQCEPCIKSCYQQGEPIYDSTTSTTYLNMSCTSDACSQLTSATGTRPRCSASTCVYGVQYSDSSYSIGFLAKDKLRMTSTDTFDSFLFGCGQDNRAAFAGAAGVLGLSRGKLSLVEQSAAKYGPYFSYCLPSSLSSTGHLTFGHGDRGSGVMWTPVLNVDKAASLYGVALESVTVGGQKLSIPASIFSNAPTIIDTGTTITRLPLTAYNALKNAFKQKMTGYPPAPALSLLDTCYDLSRSGSVVRIPRVRFSFRNNTNVELDPSGIMYIANASQVCLAFAANRYDTDVIIYGSVQMQTFEVVYDLNTPSGDPRIGFLANGCK